jgi:hypothetical protein
MPVRKIRGIIKSLRKVGMRAQSEDTDVQAERVQIDLLRKASVARRTFIAFSLSETAINLARKAIRLQDAALTDRDVLLRFVAIHYGLELAERVDKDLRRRSR